MLVNEVLKVNIAFIVFKLFQEKKENYLEVCFIFKRIICILNFLPSKYQSKEPTDKIKLIFRGSRYYLVINSAQP